jgi:hypothetical protein
MELFFVNSALCPQRKSHSDAAEMVNQLLFGELLEVLDAEKQWRKVRSRIDQYEGWVDGKMLSSWEGSEADYFSKIKRSSPVLEKSSTGSYIPFGAFIHPKMKEVAHIATKLPNVEQCLDVFLGAPYLWGGKSVLGVDCSGFTQVVMAFQGVQLKRDAYQQAEQGETIDFIEQCQTGDLAFFDNEEGKIIHVGVVKMEDDGPKIIHASGWVRKDALDHQGIYNADQKIYSHQLRIIKRNLPQAK